MNRRFTQVALAAAAAMTLSLAAPVAAHADQTTTVDGTLAAPLAASPERATASTARPAAVSPANPVAVSTFRLNRGSQYQHVVWGSSSISSTISVGVTVDPSYYLSRLEADVYVGGVKKQTISVYNSGSLYWNRAAGYGTTQLRNVRAIGWNRSPYQARTITLPTVSNSVQVRRMVASSSTTMRKSGKKITVRAKNWKVYNPNGSTVGVRKLTVKRYYKGKWRGVKHIKLSRNGNGKVSFKQKKKFKYRVYLNTTPTVQGTYMYFRGKI